MPSPSPTDPPGTGFFQTPAPVTSYFVLAYGMTWAIRSQFVLSQEGSRWFPFHATYDFWVSIGLSTFAPAVAAVLVIHIREGDAGFIAFAKRIVLWRVGFGWWAESSATPVADDSERPSPA